MSKEIEINSMAFRPSSYQCNTKSEGLFRLLILMLKPFVNIIISYMHIVCSDSQVSVQNRWNIFFSNVMCNSIHIYFCGITQFFVKTMFLYLPIIKVKFVKKWYVIEHFYCNFKFQHQQFHDLLKCCTINGL